MTLTCPRCPTTVDDKGKLVNHLTAVHGKSTAEAVQSVAALGPRACSTCGQVGHRSDSSVCPSTPRPEPTPTLPRTPTPKTSGQIAAMIQQRRATIARLQRDVDVLTQAEKLLEEKTP